MTSGPHCLTIRADAQVATTNRHTCGSPHASGVDDSGVPAERAVIGRVEGEPVFGNDVVFRANAFR